jgi:hypothetical protein
MFVLVTLKLNTRKHGKALVCNTLLEGLEVFVSNKMLLSRVSTRYWHSHSFLGDTIHQVYQETVGIVWFVIIELSSKLVL